MGHLRKTITLDRVKQRHDRYFVYLNHPVRKKTICFSLGAAADVTATLEALNRIYLDETQWHNPPQDKTPSRIYEQWMGPDAVLKLHGGQPKRGNSPLSATPAELVTLQAELDLAQRKIESLLQKIEAQGRELESLRGKKYRKGTYPTLREAAAAFLAAYTGRDADHKKNIEWDFERFILKFGGQTKIDALEGRENEINSWLRSLVNHHGQPIGPSRRMQIRVYVLKLLKDYGAVIDKTKIDRPKKKEIKKSRGVIRYLTSEQAQKVVVKLPAYFADAFRIQVRIGLRPDELLTIHKRNFTDDFSDLTLEPLEHLTLKTGIRTIPIPSDLRPVLKMRAQAGDVLFSEPKGHDRKNPRARALVTRKRPYPPAEGGKPWRDPKMFNRRFKKALACAAKAAGINQAMDCRIGRRTCASLLLQANVSAEKISALLGNSPEQILDAYGDPDVKNMSLDATVLNAVKTPATKDAKV